MPLSLPITRKSFYVFLLGWLAKPAYGQGAAGPPPQPKNGQCPVCGTQAPDYILAEEVKHYKGCAPCHPDSTGACLANCRAWTVADLPGHRQVVCSWCKVVFRQTAKDA